MAAWARAFDPSRPIHYEGDPAVSDVLSQMYPTHAAVDAIGGVRRGPPYVVCEYAHAMGNGPGGLAEYMELFLRHPRCAGGFVWEWIDHCFPLDDGSWGYGGDFGEVVHDGNFIADGLLFPDRTPSPGLLELKKVYEPVAIGGGVGGVRIENRFLFRDLGHLAFPWTFEVEGVSVGVRRVPRRVAPGGRGRRPRPARPLPAVRGEAWLTVRAVLAADEPWAPAGHEVAWGQIQIAAGRAGAGRCRAGSSRPTGAPDRPRRRHRARPRRLRPRDRRAAAASATSSSTVRASISGAHRPTTTSRRSAPSGARTGSIG